jgi:hypothetical protein
LIQRLDPAVLSGAGGRVNRTQRFVNNTSSCQCILAEYIKAERFLDRGNDDKDHHVFFGIDCNIRFHADFLSGSGLLFQRYYISAT